ncbi:hypothetical protein BJ508DRAFT_373447 [Ascobolus immersus RN42]|uniref:Stc1 domain-containing protein n=1 Tax=Ascobolus immersus RN42 TaxID=1160509 RepID=A0A3N4IMS3_ASCIM|nr:hypothetical protein BJ508DRAFT_373447 [Ascobolus immersus RN42]
MADVLKCICPIPSRQQDKDGIFCSTCKRWLSHVNFGTAGASQTATSGGVSADSTGNNPFDWTPGSYFIPGSTPVLLSSLTPSSTNTDTSSFWCDRAKCRYTAADVTTVEAGCKICMCGGWTEYAPHPKVEASSAGNPDLDGADIGMGDLDRPLSSSYRPLEQSNADDVDYERLRAEQDNADWWASQNASGVPKRFRTAGTGTDTSYNYDVHDPSSMQPVKKSGRGFRPAEDAGRTRPRRQ